MKEEITNICNQISNLHICNNCGSNINLDTFTCDFCRTKHDSIKELLKKLEYILQNEEIDFQLFCQLLNIKSLNIPFVNKIIDEHKEKFQHYLKNQIDNNNYENLINYLSVDNSNVLLDCNLIYNKLILKVNLII